MELLLGKESLVARLVETAEGKIEARIAPCLASPPHSLPVKLMTTDANVMAGGNARGGSLCCVVRAPAHPLATPL